MLPQFFSPETLAALEAECCDLLADMAGRISPQNLRCRYMLHEASGEKKFECFDPVIDLAPAMAEVARNVRLFAILSTIYGDQPHLYKDKLILKPPGTVGYPLHQDYIAWPCFPKSFLTVLVPLDASTEENGCTVVYEGYHEQGLLTPPDGKFHPVPRELVCPSRRHPLLLQPGDIAIFHGLTPHESSTNNTNAPRRQLYLSYNAHRDGGDQRGSFYASFHGWLRENCPPEYGSEWIFE